MSEQAARREVPISPGEASQLFGVTTKTLARWAASGRIRSIKTPGGHRRYIKSDLESLMSDDSTPPQPETQQRRFPPVS